jgi:hypothetical protein
MNVMIGQAQANNNHNSPMLYQYDDNCSDELLLAVNPGTKKKNNIRITHLEYVEDHVVGSLPSSKFPHPAPMAEASIGR